ncbi:MAG: hypothetical protein HZA22_04560 [Nitrospirae bacterium]|nr:hypothetical protein [Nitrospirota bacterium]
MTDPFVKYRDEKVLEIINRHSAVEIVFESGRTLWFKPLWNAAGDYAKASILVEGYDGAGNFEVIRSAT